MIKRGLISGPSFFVDDSHSPASRSQVARICTFQQNRCRVGLETEPVCGNSSNARITSRGRHLSMASSEQSAAPGNSEVWTVQRILQWTTNFLQQKNVESPRVEAELLLAHARNCNRIRLYADFNEPLTDQQRAQMRELVQRRAAREPLAYIVGAREFYGRRFRVAPGVLIPRPETESLIDCCLERLGSPTERQLLEVGIGSGCISITLLLQKPTLRITATEISTEAVAIAQANAADHKVTDRLNILAGNVLEPLTQQHGRQFHGLVSNPPYIRTDEMAELAPEIRKYEPEIALCSGADGLDVVRQIFQQAGALLADGAFLALELDPSQCESVAEMALQHGFRQPRIHRDAAGLKRIVEAEWGG